MARLFVDREMFRDGFVTITDKGDIHHIARVLRLNTGDILEISDKTKYEYPCEITSLMADRIEARVLSKAAFSCEPQIQVTLFQGIPKAGKMEGIVQKCTELGIHEIVPLWTERTVVADKGNFARKIDRWQKVADEAVKQCRRGKIPSVMKDCSLFDAAGSFSAYDLVMLAYEKEEGFTVKTCLESFAEKPEKIALVIGPEGGFSEKEVNFLVQSGAESVSLGKTILRTETAGPAMLAMVFYALEL